MKIVFFLPLLLLVFSSCQSTDSKDDRRMVYPENPLITSIASPIVLGFDTTRVPMEDYLDEVAQIDSIKHPNLTLTLSADKKTLTIVAKDGLPALSWLRITAAKAEYDILLKRSQKKKITFSFDPTGTTYKTVQLVGDINNWNPATTPMQLNGGKWTTTLVLNPGNYGYQIVTDGKWMLDPANPEKMPNGMGAFNSKLTVPVPNPAKLPRLSTQIAKDNIINIGIAHGATEVLAQWENYAIPVNLQGNTASITLPAAAKDFQRSRLRVWAYNAEGLSNDLLILLDKGQVVNTAAQLTRNDKEANIMYFMMVDRFKDGRSDNNFPTPDPEILPKANTMGGDLAGILQKLKEGYFEQLGMNTIWISPIIQNPKGAWGLYNKGGVHSKFSAYHGYWPISFSKIDERFGTPEELKSLVKEAHARNINVVLDFVAHHVHQEHPFYQAHKDWVTELHLPDGTLNTERWDDHRLTTWFDLFLPTLDLNKPEVVEMLSDSAVWWAKEYHLDGFRHDATKHIPELFWRTLTKKVKRQIIRAEHRPVYQIGETYGTPELINSYINTGMLDGQFDFNVYDAIVAALTQNDADFSAFRTRLEQSFEYYGTNNLMGYISGNQDKPRFMALAGHDIKPSDDSKLEGWKRDIQVHDTLSYLKLAQMNAVILTIPGVPCLYYGDEIGLTGGNDPDNRRMMIFEKLNTQQAHTKALTAQLAKLRHSTLALLLGDFRFLESGKTTLSFTRQYFSSSALVLVNKSDKPVSVAYSTEDIPNAASLKAHFGSKATAEGNQLKVEIPAFGFEVMTN